MKKSVVSQLILSFDVVCVATATQEVSVSSTGSLGAGGAVAKICRKISWYGLVAIAGNIARNTRGQSAHSGSLTKNGLNRP